MKEKTASLRPDHFFNSTVISKLSSLLLLLTLASLLLMSGCDSEQARIINSPTGTPDLSVLDVQTLLTQAIDAAEQIGAVVTVAVVDREANVLGVFRMTGSADANVFDTTFGSIAKARTAAYLSSNQHGFTSLTACYITRPHFPPGVKNATKLEHGTLFRVGQQLFCMTMKQDAVLNTGHITLMPVSAPQPAIPEPKAAEPAVPEKAAEAAPAAADGTPSVTFKNDGRTFPIQPGQTICEIAEANGYTINAECHAGMCGSDPIRILSGQENLSDIGDAEEEALEDICELKPGECRLACMAKVKGPVEIEIIEQ